MKTTLALLVSLLVIASTSLLASAASVVRTCPPAEPVTNDTCETAIDLGLDPTDITLAGNTAMATDDYDLGHDNPCTLHRSLGPDVVYKATVGHGCTIFADLRLCEGTPWYDQALYLVMDCTAPLAQCFGSDEPCVGGICPDEHVSWLNMTGSNQIVYIVVDGHMSYDSGAWGLDVTTDCLVPVEQRTWGSIKSIYYD